MRWSRRARELTCQQVVELVSDYLDNSLPPADRARLERHLIGCDPCVEYIDQIRTTVAITGQVDAGSVPPDTLERLAGLYRVWQDPPR